MTSDLDIIRQEIDAIDLEIIRLLARRVALALCAEEKKYLAHEPVRQPTREAQHLNMIKREAEEASLPEEFVSAVFTLIMAYSLAVQKVRRAERERENGPGG